MPQELLDLLARLNELTAEELGTLEAQLIAYFNEQRDAERTPDTIAAAREAAQAIDSVRARQQELADQQAQADAEIAALDQAVNGDGEGGEGEGAEAGEGAGDGNPETGGDPAPVTGEGTEGGEGSPEAVAAGGQPVTVRPPVRRNLGDVARRGQPREVSPARTEPRAPRRALVAAGNSGPVESPHELAEQFLSRLDSIRGARGAGVEGERVIVASANWLSQYPDERRVRANQGERNTSILEAVTSPRALVAAGGICAPLPIDYGIDVIGDTVRPVRDSLPPFGADRGGIQWIAPPTLPSVAGSTSIWTNANDVAPGAAALATPAAPTVVGAAGGTLPAATYFYRITATNSLGETLPGPEGSAALTANQQANITWPAIANATGYRVYGRTTGAEQLIGTVSGTNAFVDTGAITPSGAMPAANTTGPSGPATKPCIEVACGTPMQATVEAIPSCLQFSNFRGRFNPEQVAANVQLAAVLHAQVAEQELLRQMRLKSIAVTTTQLLGLARDFLVALDLVNARYRDIFRVDRAGLRMRGLFPHWLIEAIRIDVSRAAFPFEGVNNGGNSLNYTDEDVIAAIRSRGVEPTFYLDSDVLAQQMAAQTTGALIQLPTTIRFLLFREGTFQFLDGGMLNLGVVRDSALNQVNKYQQWSETFEGVAFRGIESLDVSMPYKSNGATAGTLTPA